MILGVFIEFFGVKIVIGLSKNHCDLILTIRFDFSQNSRYISDLLLIYLRYLPYFREFPIFRRYFGDFPDLLINRLSVGNIVSDPADNRYFGRKNQNFVPWLY